jgi:sugar-specific transcriptional regulator TrmB
MRRLLSKLNLDKKEIELYLSILGNDKNTPASLTRLTGIKRSTVCFYLDKLIKRGLVNNKISGKRKYYVAVNPQDAFNNILSDKEERINETKSAIEKLIPELKNLADSKTDDILVHTYEGVEGAKAMINKAIKEKRNIYWMCSNDFIFEIFKEEKFYKLMTLRRMKQNTTAYAITDSTVLKMKKYTEPLGAFRRVKILKDKIDIPAAIAIFGDCLVLFTKDKNYKKTVLVKNRAFAKILKLMFMSLWENLPEIN